jgi:hypothetical protein
VDLVSGLRGTVVRQISAVVLLATSVMMLGCGSNKLPTVPVSGRVTFAGGPPPARGTITFMPHSGSSPAGLPAKPGTALFETDGSFKVTSFQPGDGLLPGTYGVGIRCVEDLPSQSANPDSTSVRDHVPQGFHPDALVVKEGQDAIELTYDVPAKKGS